MTAPPFRKPAASHAPRTRLIVIVFSLVAAVFGLAPLPAGAQEGPTVIVGGPGGGAIYDHCPQGAALVGLNYTIGKDINSIGTVCRQFVGQVATGPLIGLNTWGTPVHVSVQAICVNGNVVEGMVVRVSKVGLVHGFAFICKNVATGARERTYFTAQFDGETAREETIGCGGGAMAVGIIGRYGSMVDALGLTCQILAAPPPPKPDSPPPPPPPPDNPPLNVDNNDNGDNGGGATAATDTTIYDQPEGNDLAYLSAGDPVTIVDCNGDNWCHIAQPQDGWVWGDDLNR